MKRLYDVFADGMYMGYVWAVSAEAAIAHMKNGETDNMIWSAQA